MNITKKTRYVLLGAAGALILIAIIWSFSLSGGTGGMVSEEMRRLGYEIAPLELHVAGVWEDESIRSLLSDTDLSDAVQGSIRAGFRSDIDKTGRITLLMSDAGGGDTIMLFLLDDDIELAFLDTAGQARAIY